MFVANPANQPWEMTLEEFAYAEAKKYGHGKPRMDWVKAGYGTILRGWRSVVELALRRGKPVPAHVLAEYTKLKQANPADSSLYESFHGASPKGLRPVYWEPPKKGRPVLKVGRIRVIEYEPESPSQHRNTRFYHEAGDTGTRKLRSNLILCTNPEGTQLYLVQDSVSGFPRMTERGIIG